MSDIDDCLESVKRLTRDRGEVMRAGNDLITSLRALAAARHDDLSIAVDAVIEIQRLRSR